MSSLRSLLGPLGLTALVGLTAAGCEDNESMLFIIGVIDIDRTDCVARAEGTAILVPGGTLDLTLRNSYTAALLVGSHLTQRGSREQARTETARFTLQGAEVTLTDYAGTPLGPAYSTIGTGFVNPGGGTDPGYGAMFVELLPGNGASIADQTTLARVRVFGETLGGQSIESNEYVFPLTICRGCLITYPLAANGAAAPTDPYTCEAATAMGEEESTACFIGQDSPVPCTLCSVANPACRNPCLNCAARTEAACANQPQPQPPCPAR